MAFEIIAQVSQKSQAELWKSPSVIFAIPTEGGKQFEGYNVQAIHDNEHVGSALYKWRRNTTRYPVRYAITPLIENQNEARVYSTHFAPIVETLNLTPIYSLRSEYCARELPLGSHICVYRQPREYDLIADYKLWVPPSRFPRHAWAIFCESVVRGNVPVGVFLPARTLERPRNYVVRRDLSFEKVVATNEWKKETSVQNIVSHWEIIASQYERLERVNTLGRISREKGLEQSIGTKETSNSARQSVTVFGSSETGQQQENLNGSASAMQLEE